jgi:hypothetical protein
VAIGAAGLGSSASAKLIGKAVQFGISGTVVPAAVQSLLPGVSVMGLSWAKLLVLAGISVVGLSAVLLPGMGKSTLPAAQAAPVPKESMEVRNKKVEELWGLLADTDEAIRSRALLELANRPKLDVTAYLKTKLKPLKLTAERATKLITELGDDKEEVAQAAFDEMKYFDPALALDLTAIFKAADGPLRMRRLAAMYVSYANEGLDAFNWCIVEEVQGFKPNPKKPQIMFSIKNDPNKPAGFETHLDRAGHQGGVVNSSEFKLGRPCTKEWSRLTRAIIVLEHLNTPEAISVLETMATGHEDAEPTKAAKEALARLKK